MHTQRTTDVDTIIVRPQQTVAQNNNNDSNYKFTISVVIM